MELRVHHLEPDTAPGDLTDGHRCAAREGGPSIADHRAGAVDAPPPRERRVAPLESNLQRAGRGLNRESVPPAIVLDAADPAASSDDETPPMPTPANRDFSAADKHSVSQDAELRLDDHGLDIEARPHKSSRGIPVRKPLSERATVRPPSCSSTSTTTRSTLPIPASIRRRLWVSPERCVLQESRSQRSEEHTSELQSQSNLVCRLLLEKKKITLAQED